MLHNFINKKLFLHPKSVLNPKNLSRGVWMISWELYLVSLESWKSNFEREQNVPYS